MSTGLIRGGEDKIVLSLLHNATFQEAKNEWDRRKKRINRDNIFVKMALPYNDIDALEFFDKLPYKNKVCFCPQKTSYKSAIYLPRYIWQSKYTYAGKGEGDYRGFVMDFYSLSKCVDVLKMLCGESGFVREE